VSLLFVLFALFFGWGFESEGTGWTNYAPLTPPTQVEPGPELILPPPKGTDPAP
jgi:heme/copper-type cytochrome/quinol oxidase subunit 1